MSAPTSSVPPATAQPRVGDFLHDIGTAASAVWRSSPWLAVLLCLAVAVGTVHCVRTMLHSRHAQDPVRRFGGADREIIFSRAGDRCEYYAPFVGRCDVTTGLHADHVHPHSRGGATTIANAQALCARHTITKSAHVPWDWQLARLATRRAAYFAPGEDPAVVRHHPRSSRQPHAPAVHSA
ncbi:HNH endonuclease [uncultured Jatrophihabitans sp.]|uniref:HNH endonuclease n=1 Tax=uncultured Jatrophihabitans sp. TaxID=1610747 RepID=UPI0035C95D69